MYFAEMAFDAFGEGRGGGGGGGEGGRIIGGVQKFAVIVIVIMSLQA